MYLAGPHSAHTELGQERGGNARRFRIDEEERETLVFLFNILIGPGKNQQTVGDLGCRRPHFCSIQNPTAIDLFRSEEHTSELQSLMRISYAVFCLKKKQQTSTSISYN